MQSAGSSNHHRTPSRGHSGNLLEEPKISEEDMGSLPSASKDIENDSFSDEDLHDDEETGLTKKDKRRKKHKKRNNRRLDQRIAPGGGVTAEEKKEADQNVIRRSMVNIVLILLWYLFSLSISLVSNNIPLPDRQRHLELTIDSPSTTNGCSTRTTSTFLSPCLRLHATCSYNSPSPR